MYVRASRRGGRGNTGGRAGRVAVEAEEETGRSCFLLSLVYIGYCLTCMGKGGWWS